MCAPVATSYKVPKDYALRLRSRIMLNDIEVTSTADLECARNILRAAVASRGEHNVAQWGERALGNLALTQRGQA